MLFKDFSPATPWLSHLSEFRFFLSVKHVKAYLIFEVPAQKIYKPASFQRVWLSDLMHILVDLTCMRQFRIHTVYCSFTNFQALLFCESCSWELQFILQDSTTAYYALLWKVALGKPPTPILNWICVRSVSFQQESMVELFYHMLGRQMGQNQYIWR